MKMIGPNKAISAGSWGAGVTLLVFVIGQFGYTIPPEVASAAVAFATALATWLTPHGGTAVLTPHEDPDPQP
jgi:hypothetical protein